MPPPAHVADFLDLVKRSDLVPAGALERWLAATPADSDATAAPDRLATAMVRGCLLTPFHAEQLLQGKWKCFTLGPWKVLRRLGAGSRAVVFLCAHRQLPNRRAALKVLPASLQEDEAELERFHREVRFLASLNHPNIVRAYDIDQDDKLHFLVMEHVDGPTLDELVKRSGPPGSARASHFMRQVAAGLHHAHELGVVHRHVKPSHLLLDRQGTVKVISVGLARAFHDPFLDSPHEAVLETADYLAPEAAVSSSLVDRLGDIYSLGATFYFCLTGQPPFPEGTVAQKLIWHHTRSPQPIRELRPDVPEGVVAVVVKMMAKAPKQRYQSLAEVVRALDSLSLPLESSAPAPSPWPAHLLGLANALSAGEDCHFALSDALQDAGEPDLAEHFRDPELRHYPGCWALERLLPRAT
jgi:serine/threonine protein kinase